MSSEALRNAQALTFWHALARDERSGASRTSRPPKQNLSVQDFLAQPKFIITEICGWLHPRDLLTLARTSRQLRSVFMSRETAPHWAAARQALGLPRWTAMSEPAYATLIFETACQGVRCTRAAYPNCDAIFVHGRFCNRCAKLQLLSRDEIKVNFPDLPIALVSQLPASKHRVKVDRTLETGRFHTRNNVLKLWAIFQASDFQGCTKHSVAQRLMPDLKAAKRENSIVAHQVWGWFKKDAARRRREAGPHLSQLWSRLQSRGWADEDYPVSDRNWVRLLTQVLNSPPRNEEGWRKTISSFEQVLYDHGGNASQPANNARPFALKLQPRFKPDAPEATSK